MKLSETDVAASASLSVGAYGDLEAYEDEWKDVPLGQFKALGNKLQLDVCSLIAPQGSSEPQFVALSRAEAITQGLRASGKSVATLSEEIGVVESAIQQLLTDSALIETWPTEFVLALCLSLKISFGTVCEA